MVHDTMTEAELLARSEANYYDAWCFTAATADGGETWERDGIVVAATGASADWLNIVFVARPLIRPDEVLREAVQYFDERDLPFVVRVREGLDAEAERICEAMGLTYRDTLPGMVLTPLGVLGRESSPIEIRAVEDAARFAEYASILVESFHPRGITASMLTPRLLETPCSQWYLGHLDGQPVGAAALIMTHRVAGVHYVATLEAFRRRGIGQAMTRHVVQEGAAAGCLLASLQASELGRPVYEAMGFRTITGYKKFVRPERSE